MDFKDNILQISERIKKQKEAVLTEEATKTAFIMPMINALGYDIFNPLEVVPEMDCDIAKKGDKIDYAIMKDGEPILLIECKHWAQKLDLHSTQLAKYYVASNARFGVLTNGIEYRFYADLDKTNIMDENPFLVINLLDLSDIDIQRMKKFHKSYYNESDILSTAQELQITIQIKDILTKNFQEPGDEFTRFFVKSLNECKSTSKLIEQYKPIVKKSIAAVINEIIADRLNVAIKNEEQPSEMQPQCKIENAQSKRELKQDDIVFENKENGIVTTQEEIDAYNIIRCILRSKFSAESITFKDFKSYFTIGYMNSSYWWGCRLSFGSRKKNILFPNEGYKSQEKIEIETIDDLFKYADRLIQSFEMAKASYDNYNSTK